MSSSQTLTPPRRQSRRQQLWARVKRPLGFAFLALVAFLLIKQARTIDWLQVGNTLLAYPVPTLALAAVLAAASHAIYSCFDLLGRAYTGHQLPVVRSMAVAFVSYVFNLNLGSLIGGVAFRFRLYSRLGLDAATITRVLAASWATNWLGYIGLAGGVFLTRSLDIPDEWALGETALQGLGVLFIAVVVAYLWTCVASRKRHWVVRGHEIDLPAGRIAITQWVISTVSWMVIASIVYTLLQQRVPYPTVLAVLLLAAIAGVITHVPAGLGVLETVFISMLGHVVPQHELLAALLAYRALYYLAPLLVAGVVYVRLEAKAKAEGPTGKQAAAAGPAHPIRGA